VVIADLLQTDKEELLALWLAEQVAEVVDNEQKVADKAISIAKKMKNKYEIIKKYPNEGKEKYS